MSGEHTCVPALSSLGGRPRHAVADIVKLHGKRYAQQYTPVTQVAKTLRAIALCRTAALGGHVSRCNGCKKESINYNSCRNRHCPKCQVINREKWIMAREAELLPVPYFHLVFTIPEVFNELLPKYADEVYSSLFAASWQTVSAFAADEKHLGAKPGMVSILHTWGQQLWLHPHVHCIVPGGGITPSGKWKAARNDGKYLFPKRAMSIVFRAKFMAELRTRMSVPQHIAKKAFSTKWVVYAKRPFATPKTVVEYLGRYTHRVAISNHRLLDVNENTVSFSYKDYRHGGAKKVITLDGAEFLRRFAWHILPKRFVRIRHYGFLASRNKPTLLNIARAQLGQDKWEKVVMTWQQIATERLNLNPTLCPHCKKGTLQIIKMLAPYRGPPLNAMRHA